MVGLRMWFGVVAMALAMMLGGCSTVRTPVVLTSAFDPRAAAFVHETGRAKVSGQAFVRRNTGKLLRAVGTDIYLIPRTPYADVRMAAIYGDGKQQQWGVRMPGADPLFEEHMRKTIASSGGSFSFDRVADGEYYIVAMIHMPSDYTYREFPIVERVKVEHGRSVRVVMRGY